MNICADCRNPIGTCSWEKSFIPVPGWTATETKVQHYASHGPNKYIHVKSFDVTACPLFVPPAGYVKRERKDRPVIAINIATGEETRFSSIRQAVIKGGFGDANIRAILRKERYTHHGYTFRYTKEDGT